MGGGILADIFHRVKRTGKAGVGARLGGDPDAGLGMWCAHLGMVVFLFGALGNGLFAAEAVVRAKPGDVIDLAGNEITFAGVEARPGAVADLDSHSRSAA